LANKRTAKLIIFEIKEINSIKNSPGKIIKGTFLGINNFKKAVLYIKKLQRLVPAKKQKAIKKVTSKELVTV